MHVRRVRGAAHGAGGYRAREVEREVACEVEGDAGREAALPIQFGVMRVRGPVPCEARRNVNGASLSGLQNGRPDNQTETRANLVFLPHASG